MFTLTAVRQLLKRNIAVELLCAEESRIHIEANNLGIIVHPLKISWLSNPSNILRLASLLRRGNYNLGLREQYIFPEVNVEKSDKVRGMNVTIATTAGDDDKARELLALFGMPFRKN